MSGLIVRWFDTVRRTHRDVRWLARGAVMVLAMIALPAARAEGTVRIVDQYGLGSLLLKVVKDQHLIEQEGSKAGLKIDVRWSKVSGGAAADEALLSGAADVGTLGIGPLLTIWDRTYGHQSFRALAALGAVPVYLVSNNPRIRGIKDFTDGDRIAVVAVRVSQQGRLLQMAAAKAFGAAEYARLDKLEVTMPHADATTALLAGSGVIDAHFSNVPYEFQELDDPKIHKVLSASDILGGPATVSVAATSAQWRHDNPRTYRAVQAALADAAALVKAEPKTAAAIYLRQDASRLPRPLVERILAQPDVDLTVVPHNTLPLAQFLHQVGVIRHAPASWRDYFFDDAIGSTGS